MLKKMGTIELPNPVMAQVCKEIQQAWDQVARCERSMRVSLVRRVSKFGICVA